METPKANKMVSKQPERTGERKAFMFPANKTYPVPVTVWTFTQEEADIEYQKIVKGGKVKS